LRQAVQHKTDKGKLKFLREKRIDAADGILKLLRHVPDFLCRHTLGLTLNRGVHQERMSQPFRNLLSRFACDSEVVELVCL